MTEYKVKTDKIDRMNEGETFTAEHDFEGCEANVWGECMHGFSKNTCKGGYKGYCITALLRNNQVKEYEFEYFLKKFGGD